MSGHVNLSEANLFSTSAHLKHAGGNRVPALTTSTRPCAQQAQADFAALVQVGIESHRAATCAVAEALQQKPLARHEQHPGHTCCPDLHRWWAVRVPSRKVPAGHGAGFCAEVTASRPMWVQGAVCCHGANFQVQQARQSRRAVSRSPHWCCSHVELETAITVRRVCWTCNAAQSFSIAAARQHAMQNP